MYALQRHIEELTQGSRIGQALAISLAIALVCGIAVLLATLLGRRMRGLWIGTVIACVTALGLAGVNIALSRIGILELMTHRGSTEGLDPSQRARIFAGLLSRTMETRVFTGEILGFVMASLALALARSRPLTPALRLGLFGTVAACLTLVTIAMRQLRFLSELPSHHEGTFAERIQQFVDAIEYANLANLYTRMTLVVLGFVGAAWLSALAAREARRGLRVSRWGASGGAVVLGLGATASVCNRDVAHDAYHPIPALAEEDCSFFDEAYVERLPRTPANQQDVYDVPKTASDAPLVQLKKNEVWIDWTLAANPAELEQVLHSKYELWHAIHPGQRGVSLIVGFAARVDQDARAIVPWLLAARRAGFERVGAIYTITPRVVFHSATLGSLGRLRCRIRPIAALPTTDSQEPLGTWDEFLRNH